MKKIFLLLTFLLAVPATAQPFTANQNAIPYYVNSTQIMNTLGSLLGNPIPSIRQAAESWIHNSGSATYFDYKGTTVETDCNGGRNVIVAQNGCGPLTCQPSASRTTCGNGKWMIVLHKGTGAPWRLHNEGGQYGVYELGGVVSGQFGKLLGANGFFVNNDPTCLTTDGITAENLARFRYTSCFTEAYHVGTTVGHARAYMTRWQNTSWPITDAQNGNWTSPVMTKNLLGMGGADYVRGRVAGQYLRTGQLKGIPYQYDYPVAFNDYVWDPNLSGNYSTPFISYVRPTILWDEVSEKWYAITVDFGGNGYLHSSPDRLTWTQLLRLNRNNSNAGFADITTRFPVAADIFTLRRMSGAESRQISFAWIDHKPGSSTAGQLYIGQILLSSTGGATTSHSKAVVNSFGIPLETSGWPTLACGLRWEPTTQLFPYVYDFRQDPDNCMLVFPSTLPDHKLNFHAYKADTGPFGLPFDYKFNTVAMAGTTAKQSFVPSLDGPTVGSNVWNLAVKDVGGTVYLADMWLINSNWHGWFTVGSTPIKTFYGPQIRSRGLTQDNHLLVDHPTCPFPSIPQALTGECI